MNENEYKCDACGGIFEFEKEWSEEDAKDEYGSKFTDEIHGTVEDAAIVCDDCYNKLMKQWCQIREIS